MENAVFVNRVVINPHLGKCDVTLRPGLNVIRAKLIDAYSEKSGPRNSVGKSTFVNLIDYGLGKEEFLSTGKVHGKNVLSDYCLFIEIAIGDNKFTVKRDLVADIASCQVFQGWVVNEISAGKDPKSEIYSLEEYRKLLDDSLYEEENYFNGKSYISFRKIMSFLIRDQIGGFEEISKVANYYESSSGQRKAIEFLSGLVTKERVEIDSRKTKAEKEKNQSKKSWDVIKNYVNEKVDLKKGEINKEIKKVERFESDLLTAIDGIESQISDYQRANDLRIEKKHQLLNKKLEIEHEVSIFISRVNSYKATLNETYSEMETLSITSEVKNILDRIDYDKCPVCLVSINNDQSFSCPREKRDEKNNSLETIARILKNERDDLKQAIIQIESNINLCNQNLEVISVELDMINEDLKVGVEQMLKNKKALDEELLSIKAEKEGLKKQLSYIEDEADYKSRYRQKEGTVKDILLEWESIYQKIADRREMLIKVFDKVVRFLYNDGSRRGELIFEQSGKIVPEIVYSNNLGGVDDGAAAKTLRVIAFDLTLLTVGIITDTFHPRFLVHDSPNVRDIDPVTYNRIFSYITKLSRATKKCGRDFQYIITTIEIPEGLSDENIRLELSNDGDQGKLFGFTF